jgi:hypothetical protein
VAVVKLLYLQYCQSAYGWSFSAGIATTFFFYGGSFFPVKDEAPASGVGHFLVIVSLLEEEVKMVVAVAAAPFKRKRMRH